VVARGIVDGPDEDLDKLRWTILGAVGCARSSITILTPYFLPDQALISALNAASLRGVKVDILLPGKSNLAFVQWASAAQWWQVLQWDCRVWLTRPPFDHTKLLLVDDFWAFVGSANLDPRSLRLNFEFNLECYGEATAAVLRRLADTKRARAHEGTLEEVDRRSLPVRIRDGVARLFTPFL